MMLLNIAEILLSKCSIHR